MNKHTQFPELPLELCREYDMAAEYYARFNKLPDLMPTDGALVYINADTESFYSRVNSFKYAIAMEGKL